MARRWGLISFLVVVVCLVGWKVELASGELGVNWGTISSDPLPNNIVVQMLLDNKFVKVKLFDANSDVISSMKGTNLEVMVAITNDMLATMATSTDAAAAWVKQNVTAYLGNGGVNIKYVAVGNEPFLNGYNGKYVDATLPALKNIQAALAAAGLVDTVKAVVPCNADILGSQPLPSQQTFRSDLAPLMLQIVAALDSTKSPFVVNLYPFLSLVLTTNFPIDFAFFTGYNTPIIDGTRVYSNVFDASYDGLVSALSSAGYPNMLVSVGEIGWPTDGANYANISLAQKFNQQLVNHLESGVGTPLRPGKLEAYVFSLLDENAKSTLPGNFERHWGVFNFDGSVKYPLDLTGGVSGAQTQLIGSKNVPYFPNQWCVVNPNKDLSTLPANIEYACAHADCTPLYAGGSCSGLTLVQNASYAFNTYYQFNSQLQSSCDFTGLAQVVTTDPSVGTCKFVIGLKPATGSTIAPPGAPSSANSGASLQADLRMLVIFVAVVVVNSCLLLE
ncbi:hypothetical protein M758_5G165900 [Ceratodon purpureus]|uniref:glucan endo-1,3-beta-D-glucosidase n=1 Tax=Ceratodon purpureus TaxID=3225 RepID=A0A8T0I2K2_CERPU|nr:hypothetical protein KC19_5G172600 [Ceratodon purpureus]KAG0617129.1 hypothetical protein M758_5G165900 [Ceratodon purpureus]